MVRSANRSLRPRFRHHRCQEFRKVAPKELVPGRFQAWRGLGRHAVRTTISLGVSGRSKQNCVKRSRRHCLSHFFWYLGGVRRCEPCTTVFPSEPSDPPRTSTSCQCPARHPRAAMPQRRRETRTPRTNSGTRSLDPPPGCKRCSPRYCCNGLRHIQSPTLFPRTEAHIGAEEPCRSRSSS